MERIKKVLISPDLPIKHALKKMDEAGEKILFAVGPGDKLAGVLSDGDIRRWILKGGRLTAKTSAVMNHKPHFLPEGYDKEAARKLVVDERFECVPVLDGERRIKGAVWWFEFFKDKAQKTAKLGLPVVIMAGGKGTRLAPLTNILPKPLTPIGDSTITQHIIDRFAQHGCTDIYMSVNFKANLIKAYFSDAGPKYKIKFVEEKKPLGTAGSLYLLKRRVKKTFFLSNCDVMVDADYSDILHFHRERRNKITIVGSMKHFTIPYGVCAIKNGGDLTSVQEKPEYDFLVNTGMYLVEPEMFGHIPNNKLMHMPELIEKCLAEGIKVGVYPISDKSWVDTGQWEQLQETLQRLGVK
jgi:dTDP-glucose pyrophosphorylase